MQLEKAQTWGCGLTEARITQHESEPRSFIHCLQAVSQLSSASNPHQIPSGLSLGRGDPGYPQGSTVMALEGPLGLMNKGVDSGQSLGQKDTEEMTAFPTLS